MAYSAYMHVFVCECSFQCAYGTQSLMLLYPILTITKGVVYCKLDLILCSCVAFFVPNVLEINDSAHSLIIENICRKQQLLNALGNQTTRNLQWNS